MWPTVYQVRRHAAHVILYISLKEARSPYFAYLKIDVAVTCQLFFGYHSKANSKTYPLIP
jgi:hypothetical protein